MTSISTAFTGVTVSDITAASPGVLTTAGHTYSTGDVVLHEAMDEMTELNGQLFDIEDIDGSTYWIRSPFGDGSRLSTAAFTVEATGGTSSLGLSVALNVPVAGDDITITLTGTWVATIALEKEIGFHSNAWTEVERWTANTFRTYQSKAANQRWRLRLISWTSGTITGVLADIDKIEEEFLHDDGTSYMEVTQAGVTFQEDLAVLGDTTLTGNLAVTGTQTFTGTLDVVTLDAEVIEAGDASLGINGVDAAQGGEILVTGGTSDTAANDGGAVGLVGGTPGVDGKGGAINLTGGVGGTTSDVGGAIVAAGGAASAGTTAGGLASLTGGASTGAGVGGVASVVGGAGSAATGVGGGTLVTGGAGNTTGAGGSTVLAGGAGGNDAVGGLISLTGGAAGGGNRAGGAGSVVGGAGQGTAAGGAIDLTSGAAENGTAVGPGASGAVTVGSGVAGTETTGQAGASGVVIVESAAGGAATGTNGNGGDSGALTIRTGAGGALSEGNGTGGDGGALNITAGVGGADTEDTDGTGGIGGSITLTAGTGGLGETGGDGGDIILVPGAAGSNDGGAAPDAGEVWNRGALVTHKQSVGSTITTDNHTVTVTELRAGIVVYSRSNDAEGTLTMPIGDVMGAAFRSTHANDDAFYFTVINLGVSSRTVVVAGAADFVLVGSGAMAVSTSATFMVRRTADTVYSFYRIA